MISPTINESGPIVSIFVNTFKCKYCIDSKLAMKKVGEIYNNLVSVDTTGKWLQKLRCGKILAYGYQKTFQRKAKNGCTFLNRLIEMFPESTSRSGERKTPAKHPTNADNAIFGSTTVHDKIIPEITTVCFACIFPLGIIQ